MSQFHAIDPRVYDLAGEFLMDTFPEAEQMPDTDLEQARRRLAGAMQQAIEAECQAIRKELTAQEPA